MRDLPLVLLFAVLIAAPAGLRAASPSDAEILALEISGVLLPPPDMAATITTDFGAIKTAHPYLTSRHPFPPWEIGSVIGGLTPVGCAAYFAGTGYCLDDLNASLGGTVAGSWHYIRAIHLEFFAPYHPDRPMKLYAARECVEYAEPNSYGTYGLDDTNSTELGRYTFVLAWDCAYVGMERASHHYWTLTVAGGVVRLESCRGDPLPELVGVPGAELSAPVLHQYRPNPFKPRTTIRFALPVGGSVRPGVYDGAGRLIHTRRSAV